MQAGAEPGGRVLVVAESGHEPLVRALTAEGHEVETRLPASALGAPPDVVVAVRASSGAAVLAALERRPRLPVAPVIVLSGMSLTMEQRNRLLGQVREVIAKSASTHTDIAAARREAVRRLRHHLAARTHWRPAPTGRGRRVRARPGCRLL